MQIELKYTISRALRLKNDMIKSFSLKNEFDQFFSFAIYFCFFRALLDAPAFAALANCWCRYGRIVGCRVGDLHWLILALNGVIIGVKKK